MTVLSYLCLMAGIVVVAYLIHKRVIRHHPEDVPLDDTLHNIKLRRATGANRFALDNELTKARLRNELTHQLIYEAQGVIELEQVVKTSDTRVTIAELQALEGLLKVRRDGYLADAHAVHQLSVLEMATKDGLSLPAYDQIAVMRAQSQLKIAEHKELKTFDLDMELRQALDTLSAIAKFKSFEFVQFDEVRERLLTLVEAEAQVERSHEEANVKAQKLALIAQAREAYQEVFNAFKNRLVAGSNGTQAAGPTSVTDLL